MLRRDFLTAASLVASTACRGYAPERPNILLVLADDQSWLDTGANGARHVSTPAFDRLAREGVRFTNSFSACPSCTPSRSAILMGRHVWQQEQAGVLYGAMPPSIPLYTHILEDSGYATGYTGKGWAPGDWTALGATRNPCGREFNSIQHKVPVRPGIEPSDYAANFRHFLAEKRPNAPFCFWLGSKEPHRVYDPGSGLRLGKRLEDAHVPEFLPDTREVRSDLLDYYLEIEWYDRQLAATLRVLEESGALDQTLIVATSDNGMPFPRAKTTLYDWGVRMPMAIRWGNRLKPASVVEHLVSHTDLAPTFLQAAGVGIPAGVAGQSLLPLLQNGTPASPRDQVFAAMERHTMCRPEGATYPMRSVRTRDFLYIRNFAPDRWPTGGEFLSSNKTTHGDIDAGATRDVVLAPDATKRFPKQVEWCLGKRPAEELYAIHSDPGQVHNLAANSRYQPQLAAHRLRLRDYLAQTADPRIQGRDPWQSYVYHQTSGYGASFNASLPESVRQQARIRPTHKPE